MRLKILTVSLIALFGFVNINAGEIPDEGDIKGKVVDINGQPIEFVAIILQSMDSVYIHGTLTDASGVFHLKSDNKTHRIIFQNLLFETKEMEFSGTDIGTITLTEKEYTLGEVVVKGERPIVKVDGGKLTYDVAGIIDRKAVNNAYESLLELPGVREQNGSLTLAGTNSLSVIIDGKPTTMSIEQLFNLLKNMPASRIEKAEVMYSAPPQYHVKGAAINLILNKADSEANVLQGEVNTSYAQKHYETLSSGLSLLYSTPKLSTDFMYSVRNARSKTGLNLHTLHTLRDSTDDIVQNNRGSGQLLTHNIRLGLDYHPAEQSTIGFAYTTELTPSGSKDETSNGNFSNSQNHRDLEANLQNLSIDYSSESGLKTGLNYTFYNAPSDQSFKNTDNKDHAESSFIAASGQKINKLKFYANMSHHLPKDWIINYGTSGSYASDHDFQRYTHSSESNIQNLNTDNTIEEYACNLYVGFEKKFGNKLFTTFSLSEEYYRLADSENWSLFPSADVTYLFSPSHILKFTLSSDKKFPNYWSVQESVSHLNGYAQIWGNPLLKPCNIYSSQLTYILKSKYIVTGYVNYTPDYFDQQPYQSPEELELIYQTLNWNYSLIYGLNFIIPFRFMDALDTRFTINGFNRRDKDEHFHDIAFDKNKWTLYSKMDNTINVSTKPNIKMEISGYYLTPSIQGIYDLGVSWGCRCRYQMGIC